MEIKKGRWALANRGQPDRLSGIVTDISAGEGSESEMRRKKGLC
jgi:hypothetical protein